MNIIQWFKESNRWKHLIGGCILGLVAEDWFCAVYTTSTVAAALEFKDYTWGGVPDKVDFLVTVLGGVIGQVTRQLF